ncbi:hypothetical protein WJX73_003503 [Symbiochloris irregularis]|uniref:Uncharacterized protein n=1 Tax=Symbiochloris irregularis TaxID=706552 RepID=A0AAW1NQH1_9CHLO
MGNMCAKGSKAKDEPMAKQTQAQAQPTTTQPAAPGPGSVAGSAPTSAQNSARAEPSMAAAEQQPAVTSADTLADEPTRPQTVAAE